MQAHQTKPLQVPLVWTPHFDGDEAPTMCDVYACQHIYMRHTPMSDPV